MKITVIRPRYYYIFTFLFIFLLVFVSKGCNTEENDDLPEIFSEVEGSFISIGGNLTTISTLSLEEELIIGCSAFEGNNSFIPFTSLDPDFYLSGIQVVNDGDIFPISGVEFIGGALVNTTKLVEGEYDLMSKNKFEEICDLFNTIDDTDEFIDQVNNLHTNEKFAVFQINTNDSYDYYAVNGKVKFIEGIFNTLIIENADLVKYHPFAFGSEERCLDTDLNITCRIECIQ